jgi:DNA adenine methylase
MKSPISYYGGKMNLVKEILPLIPIHKQYVEPFVGGASVFFSKDKSDTEVINDYDLRVINFWEVLKTDFEALQTKVQLTLHHEHAYAHARDILKAPISDKVEYAWAFWVQTNMSFSYKLFAGFAFSNSALEAQNCSNKRSSFTDKFYQRIKHVQIFNRDAIDLIRLKDNEDTFMYFDPPYAESNCGHYEDKKDVYYRLLDILPSLKCKWLLSSYPSEQLSYLRESNGLNFRNISQNLSVDAKRTKGKRKIECLTWNYQLDIQQQTLFAA